MLQSIQSTYHDLIRFLKQPQPLQENLPTTEKLKRLLALLILELPVMAILIAMISLLEELGWFESEGHKLYELIDSMPVAVFMLTVVVFVPFLEELIFRLPLRYRRNYLLRLLVQIIAVLSFGKGEQIKEAARRWWQRYFVVVFYGFALAFGLVHITNFSDPQAILFLIPILIAPQLILGFFLGYIRLKQGFMWSFYLHGLHNLIFISITLLGLQADDKNEIAGEGFRMQYEILQAGLHTTDDVQVYHAKDSVGIQSLALKPLLAKLLEKDEQLIRIVPEEKGAQRLNLHFKQLNDSLNTDVVILKQLQKALKFSLSPDSSAAPAWGLVVTDSSMLNNLKAKEQHQAKTISSKEKFSLQPAGMEALSSLLTNASDSVIVDATGLTALYELEITRGSFEEMRSQLQQKYGLDLQYMPNSPEYVVVRFEE